MERPDGSPFKVREFIPHDSMPPYAAATRHQFEPLGEVLMKLLPEGL